MQIQLKLMGVVKEKSPPDGCLTIPDGGTIADVLAALDVPADSVQVFTVNGKLERDQSRVLVDGDELTVIPPVGGG